MYDGDSELVHLKYLTNLQELHLQKNITDAGMVHVGGLAGLTNLNLGWHPPWARGEPTQVTDAGLVDLRGLTNLTELSIDSDITDTGMVNVADLPKHPPLFRRKRHWLLNRQDRLSANLSRLKLKTLPPRAVRPEVAATCQRPLSRVTFEGCAQLIATGSVCVVLVELLCRRITNFQAEPWLL